MAILLIVFVIATKRMEKVPGRFQCLVEYTIEGLLGFFAQILGEEKARRYFPLLGTLFLFILLSNWSGLLPFAGYVKGFSAPTSTISVTVALALIAFVVSQIAGCVEKGILGYLKGYVQPFAFLLPLTIIEELVKPVSLSLRLFGNIYGGETVVAVLLAMAPFFVPIPMQFLDILFGFIQALVFTTLTAVYIDSATADAH
jgi:F-type H+-transporting ATPase subunit a